MGGEAEGGDRLTVGIRWTARVWTIVTIVVVVLLSIGEGIHPAGPAEMAGLLLYPVGICLGMVLAWWKEGVGGMVTVASLLAFYVLHTVTAGRLPQGWAWLILAVPGFLFVWCWARARHPRTAAA
jgi:hypothetical protein